MDKFFMFDRASGLTIYPDGVSAGLYLFRQVDFQHDEEGAPNLSTLAVDDPDNETGWVERYGGVHIDNAMMYRIWRMVRGE